MNITKRGIRAGYRKNFEKLMVRPKQDTVWAGGRMGRRNYCPNVLTLSHEVTVLTN